MSSCLSGGAAYSFEREMMISPPSRAVSHNTPSPSSTISESNSPPLSISTRKRRTQRKRPNQTYDEAAALLSTAYPNIFSSKKKPPLNSLFLGINSPHSDYDEASQLLLPFGSIEETDFVNTATIQTKTDHFFEHTQVYIGGEVDDSEVNRYGRLDELDAESILDDETEEGLDSFMGNIESNEGENHGNEESGFSGRNCHIIGRLGEMMNPWYGPYGSSMGFGEAGSFRLGLGMKSALREINDVCNYPTVEFEQISPRLQTTITAVTADEDQSDAMDICRSKKITTAVGDKKKKKTKVARAAAESKNSEAPYWNPQPDQRMSPMLKLDYDGVLEAWSDKDSPLSDEILGSVAVGIDVHARLGEIDLFGEREAIELNYREKRRNRLFSNSKKIRYQVRKLNADQRPRLKRDDL